MTQRDIIETRQSILFMCLLTVKSIIIAMIVGFGLLFAVLNISPADAATLRPVSTVNDDMVRVSDVFADAEKGEAVIGRAPQPGTDMVINARTLSRIAKVYNIDWTPSSVTDQVVLRREAHTVSSMDIQDAVKIALEKRGMSSEYSITLSNMNAAITLPRNLPATAEVSNLSYTPGRDVFTATIASPSADNPVKTINVSGTLAKTVTIPVLKTSLKNGEIIGSGDIDWIDVSEKTLMPDTVIDADKLIGKTPSRVIGINSVIRMKDVTNPQLVARGDEITIIVKTGGMQLTAKGKAMQNGAEGDIIRAVNTTSNRSLTAMITGDRTVTVQ